MVRRVFIVVFGAMAAGQIASLPGFVDALERYDVAGRGGAIVLASILVVLEVAAVVLLTARARQSAGAILATVAMSLWTAVAIQAFARGLVVPNCGCFGTFLAQELRWWVLVEDAYLLVLAGLLLRSTVPGDRALAADRGEPALPEHSAG